MEQSLLQSVWLFAYLLLSCLSTLVWAQDPSATSSSPAVLPTVCGDIVTYANQDLLRNDLFDSLRVYQCLTSVPFLDAVALRYIDYYNATIQFQSTLAYLKVPPASYQQPSVDVADTLRQIRDNVTAGYYANQYDFEASLWSLVQRMHDSHVTLNSGVLSAFTFGSPFDIMSVSTDGRQTPRIYIKEDVINSRSQGYTPSAITSINSEDVTTFLQRYASVNAVGTLEPHADWNQLMYSPVQDVLGTFNLFGWNAVLYPGDNLVFTFENGSTIDTSWLSYYMNNEHTGPLTTGGDFYNYFVLGLLPASYVPTGNTNVTTITPNITSLPSWASVSAAYPNDPVVVQPQLSIGGGGGIVTGYFLNDISTAVLSIPNFDDYGVAAQSFSNTTAVFIQRAKAAGLTRVVIDLQQNNGGDPLLAFDTFQQFFPNIEPFAGSRRRSHQLGNVLGATITDFWNDLTPQNPEYQYARYYGQMAANEWVITDRLNAATGQNFSSWDQYDGPVASQGDQFSLVERYNLSSAVFARDAAQGFVPRTASAQSPPWSSQDIVILTDGICGSTCSLFVEMMTYQGGVRTVVVGGEPRTGPMQAASGSRGARAMDAYELDQNMKFAGLVNRTANTTLPQVREQAIFTYSMSFNLRDQIRQGDTTPLQFRYEAANCRIFHTFANAYNLTQLWRDAATATWTDPSLCVEGSTGFATTGNSTVANNPPALAVQAPDYQTLHSNIHAQHPGSFGVGMPDAYGNKVGGEFTECGGCDGSGCVLYDCANGQQVSVCTPSCDSAGGSCSHGEGSCQGAAQYYSKENGPNGEDSLGYYEGTCYPGSGSLERLCPADGQGDPAPP